MQPTARSRGNAAISLALAIFASVLSLVAVTAGAPAATAETAPTVTGQPCAPGVGVTVVVDYQQLGQIEVGCAPGQQTDGFAALTNAGFSVNDKPGALSGTVCQIEGLPTAGYPACWFSGFWGYWKSDGTQAWQWSDVGASSGPLAVDRVEGWSWTDPIPEDYSGQPMRIDVDDLDELLVGDADCAATVQLPAFGIVDNRETLPITLDDDHAVDVAILSDPNADPATATWTQMDSVPLTGLSGKVRILARRAGNECANAPTFDATYDVRGAYAPRWNSTGGGSPSPAIDKASTAFVGWATGHSEYTPGGNVNASFQTPTNAYGPIDSSLVVLGDRGSITMTFGSPITDGPGYDFAPFENGFASGANDFLEFAYVEVSSNGTDFVRFDSASRRAATVAAFGTQDPAEIGGLAGKDLAGKGTPFDLALLENKPDVRSGKVDLHRITHVRLKDIQGDGNDNDSFGRPIYDPNPVTGSAGYDLTGIGILNALDEVAPVVTVTSAPTGTVTDTDAEIAFTVDDATATVERQLDNGTWTSVTSPFTLTGLSPGAHTVTVRATDPSGNVGIASATWTVLGPRDCAVGPVLPDLGILDHRDVLPVRMADGHPAEVAVLSDLAADPANATYATATQVDLASRSGQRVRVVARAAEDTCTSAPTFNAVYDVRNAYAPRVDFDTAPGQPSEGIARTDGRFVAWANRYERYRPGTNVDATWKAPWAAETGPIPDTFGVLGDHGTIDLLFDNPIRNGEGADFAVFENGFAVNPPSNGLDFLELARVAVTTDGEHWATFDTASRRTTPVGAYEGQRAEELGGLAGKDLDGNGTPFDLTNLRNAPQVRSGLVDLNTITKVRIIDSTGDGNDLDSFGRPIYDPYPNYGSGGFDFTGLGVLNQTTPPTIGDIDTIAGNGLNGNTGDGGPAVDARLTGPNALAKDAAGNLYIADAQANRVRKVTPYGRISLFAGGGGESGEGVAATEARLRQPDGLAVAADGSVYIAEAEGHRIRKVAPDGTISTLAGTGDGAYGGDGGPALDAQFNRPGGLRIHDGKLLVADFFNSRVRSIDLSTGAISTVAGTGTAGHSGDGGAATDAEINTPTDVDVAPDGDIVIADYSNHRIRRVDAGSGTISTIAGTGTAGATGDGGAATAATLNYPQGLAIDRTGAIYVADYYNSRVRKISPTGTIDTAIGTGTPGYNGDHIPATTARLQYPGRLLIDAQNRLYVSDLSNRRVRAVRYAPLPPTVTITSGPSAETAATDATIAFDLTPGAGATTECRLDGGDWSACTSPASLTQLGDGDHEFEVRSSLPGSDWGSDSIDWSVDATAPVIEITDAPTGTIHTDSARVAFTVDDDDAATQYRLDAGTWVDATSPIQLSGLADGAHTIEVRAVDAVLNVGADTAAWTVQTDQFTADESWAIAAYTDFLGRAPTAPERASIAGRLQGGTKRSAIAEELSTSDEWVRAVVTRFYDDTLTREPDTAGLNYWVNQIRTGKRTVAQVAVQFYASSEYYRNIGGGTDTTWVKDLYVKLLHRQPDTAGLAYWKVKTASRGRAFVAGSIYGSPESRRDRVDGLYRSLLGRGADPSGVAYWANRITREGDLALAVHLVVSTEYGRRAEARFP